MAEKKASKAAIPPADAPMPTTGKQAAGFPFDMVFRDAADGLDFVLVFFSKVIQRSGGDKNNE